VLRHQNQTQQATTDGMAPADMVSLYSNSKMGIGELYFRDSPADMHLKDLKETEADVSAEFYHQCQKLGLTLKMEVRLPSDVHRSGMMRVDALVFQLGTIVCAVEFKVHRKHASKPQSRQYRAYSGLGFPFFFCCGTGEIEDTIENVVALADKLI